MWRCLLVALAAAWLALSPAQAECFAGDAGFADTGGVLCGGANRPTVSFNFLSGVLDPRITFTRASAETNGLYTDAAGSTFTSFGNNVPVFQATGLQIYEARINSLLNSAAPVTQTTASLGTGTYVFWCIGTGSVTSSAGTATATGLGAITCSQSTFQTIAITVAGTLTFTVTGSVNRFQLELGAFPTPFIQTAGAALARAVDVATAALSKIGISGSPNGLTFIGKGQTSGGNTAISQTFAEINDGTSGNRVIPIVHTAAGNLGSLVRVAGVTQVNNNIFSAVPANTPISFWMGLAINNYAAQVVGKTKATNASVGVPTGLTTLDLGSDVVGEYWNSTLAKLQVYNRRLPDAQAAAIAAAL